MFGIGVEPNVFFENSKVAFGGNSIFSELERLDGYVCLFGVVNDELYSPLTYIHYVEQLSNIPYRYNKIFNGVIDWGRDKLDMRYTYRVWPKTDFPCFYDWPKIMQDLENFGVAQIIRINGKPFFFIAKAK